MELAIGLGVVSLVFIVFSAIQSKQIKELIGLCNMYLDEKKNRKDKHLCMYHIDKTVIVRENNYDTQIYRARIIRVAYTCANNDCPVCITTANGSDEECLNMAILVPYTNLMWTVLQNMSAENQASFMRSYNINVRLSK